MNISSFSGFIVERIISGGQTGVDRAALDVCLKLNVAHGGWCPRGRRAEDGVIAACYQLVETKSDDYSERTKLNIQDSTGTLIIVPSLPLMVNDGTVLTMEHVKKLNKPHYILDLSKADQQESQLLAWLHAHKIVVLNVAGPRESQANGIYDGAFGFLEKFIINYFRVL
jgi:hypothetical protein